MGCRERTRGAIAIPGDRPAGILQQVLLKDIYQYGRIYGW